MRSYPVVNLGGMLEDYKNEISQLKAKLNPGGYMQPGPNPPYSPPAPPPTGSPGTTGATGSNGWPSGYAPPITVPTGAPEPEPERLPPYPPNTVSTGIPPQPYTYPFIEYPVQDPCPLGYHRDASGVCVQSPGVASEDRNPSFYRPPPTTIVNEPPPPPPPPPSTVRTESGGVDTIYRGGGGLPGGLFSGGETSMPASGISLMGRLPYSGAPALLRPIKLRGY